MLNKIFQFSAIIIILGSFMVVSGRLDRSESLIYPDIYYSPHDYKLDTNDQNWEETRPHSPVYWIKAPIILKPDLLGKDLLIAMDISGSFDVFWNGDLIGKNGVFSTSPEQEYPGKVYTTYIVPGEKVYAVQNFFFLHVSHHAQKNSRITDRIAIGEHGVANKNILVNSVVIHFLAGAFFIVAVYFAFLYFISYRKAAFILFSFLCIAGFCLIMLGFSKVYYPIPYDLYDWRFWIFRLISFTVALGTPLFLFFHFDVPGKNRFIPILCVASLLAWMLPTNYNWVPLLIGFGAEFLVTIWALIKRKPGSVHVLIGLLAFVIGFIYFNISIYIGFSILVIAILFSLSLSFREERRKQVAAELRSARLKTELLRKSIQPHFLMNTLTTIISLIESDPKKSIEMIETLSEEFSTLSEIAEKKLIELKQELDLCRSYLKLMSIRNDIEYSLKSSQSGLKMKIPPAIVHTLIENGVTHNSPISGQMTFNVFAAIQHDGRIIEVISHGLVPNMENKKYAEGMGLRYVKARLDENFSQNWEIKHENGEDYWKTTISIKGK